MSSNPEPSMPASHDDLVEAILNAPRNELPALLDHPLLDESLLLLLLRRPDLSAGLLRSISERRAWLGSYLVKAALVFHAHTPKVIGLNLVKFLFWRDLVKVVGNLKLEPGVRRLAEVTLRDRVLDISLGERIALARIAPREAIRHLRREQNVNVMQALLVNSRLTEEDVLAIAQSVRTPTAILSLLARSDRWTARTSVRVALVRNPRSPLDQVLALIRRLTERDLLGLVESPQAGHAIRAAAARALNDRRKVLQPRRDSGDEKP